MQGVQSARIVHVMEEIGKEGIEMRQNMRIRLKKGRYLRRGGLLAAAGMAVLLAGCSFSQEADNKQPSQTETPVPSETPEASEPETPTPSESETIESFPGRETDADIPAKPEKPEETEGSEESPAEPEVDRHDWDVNLILGTDIHYLAQSLTDGGSGFQYMVEHGDGKVVTYIDQITDAFLEEVIRQEPDVLILSGDLTLDGEKRSHEDLAAKLYEVEDAGIPVLVIPGNHDINNHHAAQFRGNDRLPAEFTTPAEFRDIYRDFGYDEAISEDRTSLSYVYELDDKTRFLMLDSCQYKQKALVGGAILSDTYDWIEEQLEDAWDCEMNIIPVAHHNLLDESEIYVEDCTIEHGEQLVDMLENWDVPVFLSGHLHVQHTKRSEDNRGVWEMVTSSLATPACQFGNLGINHNGSFCYWTQAVDVESWAKRHGSKEKDLLEFNTFKEPFLRRVFYNQSYDALQKIPELTENQRKRMSNLYSGLNYHYYQGTAYKIKEEAQANSDYKLWLEDGSFTVLSDYVQYIIRDAKRDYNKVAED